MGNNHTFLTLSPPTRIFLIDAAREFAPRYDTIF